MEITDIFGGLTSEEVVGRLEDAGIANARMRTVREFSEHPQLEARDRWRDVGSPSGTLRALLPPVMMEGVTAAMGPVPALGEHTETVLGELGFDGAFVSALRGGDARQGEGRS